LINLSLQHWKEDDEVLTGNHSVKDGATELLDEPELGIIHVDALELADAVLPCSAVGNSVTRSLQDNGEVHAENTSGGVILNSEINMLIDTKAEVAYSSEYNK